MLLADYVEGKSVQCFAVSIRVAFHRNRDYFLDCGRVLTAHLEFPLKVFNLFTSAQS